MYLLTSINNILMRIYNANYDFHQKYGVDHNTKKERLSTLINNIDNKLKLFNISQQTCFYIIYGMHLLSILILICASLFMGFNILNNLLVSSLGLIQASGNSYYGSSGCVLTRLERHYKNDKNWYGPATPVLKLLHIPITKYNVDISIGIAIMVFGSIYIYRKFFLSK